MAIPTNKMMSRAEAEFAVANAIAAAGGVLDTYPSARH